MKRSPLDRGSSQLRRSPLRRRTPLAKVGRRARLKRVRRSEVIALVHARDVVCQFGSINPAYRSPCRGRLDVHEIIPRSAWPAGQLEDANCVLLCRGHHDWVGDFPEVAHLVGLHGFSWDRPDGHVSRSGGLL